MVKTAIPEIGNTNSSQLTLGDLREVLFNGEAEEMTDIDVLEEMAKDKRGLVKKILQNKALIERAGNPDQLLHELELLHERYSEEIKTLEAAKGFEKKVEKQSWGRWALEKVKSVVLFPVRYPVYSLLILAAVLAGVGLLYQLYGEALLQLIPNYASKVVDVARRGVQALSEGMTEAAEAIHSGRIPFAEGIGASHAAPPPAYGTGPGIFASPTDALSVPTDVLPGAPGIPVSPLPGAGTVPVPPTLPPDVSPIGRELL